MKQTTPIISGSMNLLRLPAFFENLGHSNVILTAGGESFGHKDGPKIGAIACRQAEEAWKQWKAGHFGNISLSDGVIEYAKTHEEIIAISYNHIYLYFYKYLIVSKLYVSYRYTIYTHEEIKGAFLTFPEDADQIYPGWKEKLHYTGESFLSDAEVEDLAALVPEAGWIDHCN